MSEYGSNPNSQLGRRMLWVAAIGLLGALYLLFSMLENGGSGTVSSVDSTGATMVVLEQGRNGHYEAEGQINGRSVTFLVDTGATDVKNVRATITDGEFNGVLLGMSFLKYYDLQQQDGRLVIREATAND